MLYEESSAIVLATDGRPSVRGPQHGFLVKVSKTDLAQAGRLVPLDSFPAESLSACPVRAMMKFLRA
jgi:hypothetical protein